MLDLSIDQIKTVYFIRYLFLLDPACTRGINVQYQDRIDHQNLWLDFRKIDYNKECLIDLPSSMLLRHLLDYSKKENLSVVYFR